MPLALFFELHIPVDKLANAHDLPAGTGVDIQGVLYDVSAKIV